MPAFAGMTVRVRIKSPWQVRRLLAGDVLARRLIGPGKTVELLGQRTFRLRAGLRLGDQHCVELENAPMQVERALDQLREAFRQLFGAGQRMAGTDIGEA